MSSRNLFLTWLEVVKSKSRCQNGGILVKTLSLIISLLILTVSSHGTTFISFSSHSCVSTTWIKQLPKTLLNIHWKDWCWCWNSNTLATWYEELTHLKRPWCWERLKTEGEGDDRGWDGWMASPTQWTWVWANSRSWWGTERLGIPLHGAAKSQTWLSNWTEKPYLLIPSPLASD